MSVIDDLKNGANNAVKRVEPAPVITALLTTLNAELSKQMSPNGEQANGDTRVIYEIVSKFAGCTLSSLLGSSFAADMNTTEAAMKLQIVQRMMSSIQSELELVYLMDSIESDIIGRPGL